MADLTSSQQEKLNTAREALEAAREIRRLRREYGVDYIHMLVSDVDGDWLETWGDGDEKFQKEVEMLLAIADQKESQQTPSYSIAVRQSGS
jgi:hypothetical protein